MGRPKGNTNSGANGGRIWSFAHGATQPSSVEAGFALSNTQHECCLLHPRLIDRPNSEAVRAAETFAMQRMTHSISQNTMAVRTRAVRPRTVRTRTILTRMGRTVRTAMAAMTLFAFSIALVSPSNAQVVHADADYDASGFVTPAGMAPPELNGGIMPAGYYPSDASSCDSGGCDSGCCDSAGCDSGGCDSMYGSGNMYGSPGGMYGGQGGVFNGSGGMQGGMFPRIAGRPT